MYLGDIKMVTLVRYLKTYRRSRYQEIYPVPWLSEGSIHVLCPANTKGDTLTAGTFFWGLRAEFLGCIDHLWACVDAKSTAKFLGQWPCRVTGPTANVQEDLHSATSRFMVIENDFEEVLMIGSSTSCVGFGQGWSIRSERTFLSWTVDIVRHLDTWVRC